MQKLDFLNSQHLANLNLLDFKNYLKPFMDKLSISMESHKHCDLLIESMRTSANNLQGIAINLKAYYLDEIEYDERAIKKFVIPNSSILNTILTKFELIDLWNEENLDQALKEIRESLNIKIPQVNQPIRIALTGSTNSPSLGLTMFLFGKDESLKRIQNLINHV